MNFGNVFLLKSDLNAGEENIIEYIKTGSFRAQTHCLLQPGLLIYTPHY